MTTNELNIEDRPANAPEALLDLIQDAIDLASDQDQMTYLTNSEGKRIAAIVPVDMAEHGMSRLELIRSVKASEADDRICPHVCSDEAPCGKCMARWAGGK